MGSFRDFVTNEKQRLAQKKQQIFKKEKDNRLADLLKFSQEFKVCSPTFCLTADIYCVTSSIVQSRKTWYQFWRRTRGNSRNCSTSREKKRDHLERVPLGLQLPQQPPHEGRHLQ